MQDSDIEFDELIEEKGLTQAIIEYLNLDELEKLLHYKSYRDSEYKWFIENTISTWTSRLHVFNGLKEQSSNNANYYTNYDEFKKILVNVFEMNNPHPTDDYTKKLDTLMDLLEEAQKKHSNMYGENSDGSCKANFLIQLCKDLKILREQYARHYMYDDGKRKYVMRDYPNNPV